MSEEAGKTAIFPRRRRIICCMGRVCGVSFRAADFDLQIRSDTYFGRKRMSWTLGKCARVHRWLAGTMMILCLMAAGLGRAQVLANPDNPPAQNKEDEKKDAKKDDKK